MRKLLFLSLAALLLCGAKIYAQDEQESYVKISTATAVGEKIRITVDRPVYLYWNNDHKTFLNGGEPTECEVQTQDFKIGGEFEILYCGANKLTSIESHVASLKTLECSQNLLTNLDLSGSPELKWVMCNNNKLKRLNLKNNTNLKTLNFAFNEIRGKAMDELVESLYSSDKYKILSPIGPGDDNVKEKNLMMKKQVEVATSKGWKVGFLVGAGVSEYKGEENAPYKKYTLTLGNADHGSIATEEKINLSEIEEGTTLRIVATPEKGYILSSLKANGEDILNTMLVTLVQNTTIEAQFSKDTGIEKVEANLFSCYPNPTTDFVNIRLGKDQNPLNAILIDQEGRILERVTIVEGQAVLDLRSLSPGIYVVRVGSQTTKIIRK